MPTGLTDPLAATDYRAMTTDELCEHHRELLLRVRDVDHWRRLIGARLDLAIAAVTDLPEPAPPPAVLMPAMTAAAEAAQAWPKELLAAVGGDTAPFAPGDDLIDAGVITRAGPHDDPRAPFVAPPDGLRDLLGIPRADDRLPETALLPRLRQALAELDAYGDALRAVAHETAHLIALRNGVARLPA